MSLAYSSVPALAGFRELAVVGAVPVVFWGHIPVGIVVGIPVVVVVVVGVDVVVVEVVVVGCGGCCWCCS